LSTAIASVEAGLDTAVRMQSAPMDPPSNDEDQSLMLAYARGDVRAFERLYDRHKGATYRYFLRHADGHAATAEELHQDLWMKVVGARQHYAPLARFTTWLYTMARHRLADHWRSRSGIELASLQDETIADEAESASRATERRGDDPLQASIDAQARERVVRSLREVPVLQRDAFLLHVDGGLSVEQIGALSGTSSETIKSRLRYAYRRLREALEERP
jgi:RNA polymerase sigma-70 factor (ECF subfamily)